MRAVLTTSILAVALIATRPLNAQTGKFSVTVGGGLTLPMSEVEDSIKTGGHGRVTLGYRPLDSKHVWSFEAGLSQHEQITRPEDNLGKVHANIMTFLARYDQDIGSAAYFTAAIGMVRNEYKVRVSNVVLTNTDSHVGIGGGIGLTLGHLIFVEGRLIYSIKAEPNTILVPITVGVRF